MKPNIVILGDYQISKSHRLGQGTTGEVYYGQNMKNECKVAAKQIDINKITQSIEKQIENQIKNLTKLSSAYIVKLYDYFRCGNYIYLFLEYCEDGDLRHYLETQKKKCGLCENEALMFMRHIIEGYKALYEQKIIHRDIKPANILLKQGIAKLSDFGFSRVINNPNESQKMTLLGTPLYTAPEILAGNEFCSKCDVWSMGVVFYQMLHARTPWTGTDLQNLLKNIHTKPLQFKESIHPELKMLISRMLCIESKERIAWDDIFKLAIFNKELIVKPAATEEKERSYSESRQIFVKYINDYKVKSYLRVNMETETVRFKKSIEPEDIAKKEIIASFSRDITHRRNVAFFYCYVLYLYYQHSEQLPQAFNRYMEFEFALILKTFHIITQIAEYFEKKSAEKSEKWLVFKQSSDYDELKALLSNDFAVVDRMRKKTKREAERRFKAKELNEQTVKYFNALESKLDQVFDQIMRSNFKELAQVKTAVAALIAQCVSDYVLAGKKLQENINLDFGAFYEARERAERLF